MCSRVILSPKVKVTLHKGLAGLPGQKRLVLRSLGLSRISSSRVHPVNSSLLGQLNKVIQFVTVEEML